MMAFHVNLTHVYGNSFGRSQHSVARPGGDDQGPRVVREVVSGLGHLQEESVGGPGGFPGVVGLEAVVVLVDGGVGAVGEVAGGFGESGGFGFGSDRSTEVSGVSSRLAIPVEVILFCCEHSRRSLVGLFADRGCLGELRRCGKDEEIYMMNNRNYVIDLYLERDIGDLKEASDQILRLPGIVEKGMFLAIYVIVVGVNGVTMKTKVGENWKWILLVMGI
ncbi:Probable ribose-5-phosphate isomerase 1 [Striga hermonthica]|uniref:Probable ribose-5-phosphate isomerase 1 n=1 Tax=Striga hermonthica TaxID=68872 RepID=A0A9N7MHW7_STRHE|nr:Probable ribose-5-phosphate isomerase 1 [Striga hermonthica]